MKRLILLATMVAVLASCEKTEIQNEVLTPIGFSSNVGKQTKAIVDDATYFTTQPFGVYAYGHQENAAATTIMNNVEISQVERTINDANTNVWAATDETKYYWPNDPTTTINFYAYSPAHNTSNATANLKEHQKLTGTISHSETAGLSLTNYVHANMYVDFMVANHITGATYTNPDGDVQTTTTAGTVPLTFNHKMTQIIFKISTAATYAGVKFTIEEITLKNIKNCGNYKSSDNTWSSVSKISSGTNGIFTIFPADSDNGAIFADSRTTVSEDATLEASITLDENTTSMVTTGVTMIPQTIEKATTTATPGTDSYKDEAAGQMFMIKYKIEGTGVATETVVKHVPFRTTDTEVINWGINKKITYNVKIGLQEIYFEPKVATWETSNGEDITIQ